MLLELHSHIVSISNTVWMDKNDKTCGDVSALKNLFYVCFIVSDSHTMKVEHQRNEIWMLMHTMNVVWCMVYVGWSANASTQHNSLFILAVARMPVNTVRFANLAKRDWTICNTFCLFICIYICFIYIGFCCICAVRSIKMCT